MGYNGHLNQMKKTLSLLVACLFATALIAAEYPLYVGGMQITDYNKDDIIGALKAQNKAGYVLDGQITYNPEAQILTLKNATLKTSEDICIESQVEVNSNKKQFTIVCVGKNEIYTRGTKGALYLHGEATNSPGRNVITGDTLTMYSAGLQDIVGIYVKNGDATGGNGGLRIECMQLLDLTASKWGIYAWELPIEIRYSHVKILVGTNDAIARSSNLEILASQVDLESKNGYAVHMVDKLSPYWEKPSLPSDEYAIVSGILQKNGADTRTAKWLVDSKIKATDTNETWRLFGKDINFGDIPADMTDITAVIKSGQTNTKISGTIKGKKGNYPKLTFENVNYEIERIDTEKESPFCIYNGDGGQYLEIELIGENTITTKNSAYSVFRLCRRAIRFVGTGKLTINTDAPTAFDLIDGTNLIVAGTSETEHPTVIINGAHHALRGNAWANDAYEQSLSVTNAKLQMSGGSGAVINVKNVTIVGDSHIENLGVTHSQDAKSFVKDGKIVNYVSIGFDPISAIGQVDETPNVKAQKIIRDGQLFIIRGDKMFNAAGQQVK